jgi:ribosomal protein RSM22 (predicted rRNA methylase)
LANLLARLRQAGAVLWVEPGASRQSRQLAHCRETLRDEFELVGPCAHQKACGMLHADRRNDWCHFFAKPPAEAFHTRFWAEFHKQLGIDARSLPVSFIALVHRNGAYRRQPTPACRRVLARPRILKGRCELLVCDEQGVHAETVLKRHSKALFKGLQKDRFERWLDQNIVP